MRARSLNSHGPRGDNGSDVDVPHERDSGQPLHHEELASEQSGALIEGEHSRGWVVLVSHRPLNLYLAAHILGAHHRREQPQHERPVPRSGDVREAEEVVLGEKPTRQLDGGLGVAKFNDADYRTQHIEQLVRQHTPIMQPGGTPATCPFRRTRHATLSACPVIRAVQQSPQQRHRSIEAYVPKQPRKSPTPMAAFVGQPESAVLAAVATGAHPAFQCGPVTVRMGTVWTVAVADERDCEVCGLKGDVVLW